MKSLFSRCGLVLTVWLLGLSGARAFPPAPDIIIYGMVKDSLGTPLVNPADQVVLQSPSGVQVTGNIQPGLAIGVNYTVNVPMDAGTLGGAYNAKALFTAAQYKLYVTVGATTNLPIEMISAAPVLGLPATLTLQNLTLGTDANGDGIPDQWEQAFLTEIGTNLALGSINPNGIYTSDGRTLKQEYQLGNYPFNPGANFQVQIVQQSAGSATLAFTTMTGRSYTAYGSPDLQNWTPLAFTVPSQGPAAMAYYYSPIIQPLQIQTVQPTNAPTMQFFRLQLQ